VLKAGTPLLCRSGGLSNDNSLNHILAVTATVLVLLQIREESDIDALITPIEDMYSLLLRYEVRGHHSN
jgi:hypothetical protein